MTPDEDFVIGPLPGMPRIIVASPCSGHGFKFSPAIGEILADLATKGETAPRHRPFLSRPLRKRNLCDRPVRMRSQDPLRRRAGR